MTKDYKEPTIKDPQSGGYGWMFSGIALGLLIGLGMYFYSSYTASNKDTNPQTASSENPDLQEGSTDGGIQAPDPISVVIENARMEQTDRKRASFSYYAVLPNLELDVNVKPSDKDVKPASELSEAAEGAIEKVVLKPGMHILQIASFKAEAQARRSQKKLNKKGLNTRIEKRKIKGVYWYRLFAGPTQQENEISGWKALVVKSGFKPLVVKVK